MGKLFIKDKTGLTLIEVMIVVALLGIVITVMFSLLFFGTNTFSISSRQYDLQSDLRFAMDTIVREVRFATNLEIISSNDASDTTQHEEDYNYFYIDGEYLYHVKYDEDTGSHNTMTYGGHFKSDSSLFRRVSPTTLGIEINSIFGNQNQTYSAQTEIGLTNLKSSGGSILGLEDLGLKYSSNKEILAPEPPPIIPAMYTITGLLSRKRITKNEFFSVKSLFIPRSS
ncbi:MAG: prepilin-type N-terminal cleavage/methylation domain-containing protein [Tindallia sp. MSAO_Bac2]|nr:MAG: prepilin-type N-terminal cleavage/methylation domain-containing protein [Tindallia sp. MSAO_Bac2]